MGASEPGNADGLDEAVLLSVLSDVKNGDFSVRMPLDWTGVPGKIADRLNEVIAANETLGADLARVSRVVGREGKLSQRVVATGSGRVWADSVESVNCLIDDLVRPTSEMQRVIGAVAGGDLSKKITADVEGEVLELKHTINGMVDQLNLFISEVTRVIREVGTEGKLGQAAAVTIEVGGVWKDLTDNVNVMAGNLTGQVRDIAEVTTAVANGDLSKKISADVKGESSSSRTPATRWSTSSTGSRPRSPAWRARSGSRAGSAARRSRPRSPASGRTSPTTSTSSRPTSPTRCARSRTWRPR
jgi:HAMP domain-containing protein